MPDRARLLFFAFCTPIALLLAGCSYSQQSNFQMSFLPSTPHRTALIPDVPMPPVVQPNLYLADAPAFINVNPQAPSFPSRGESLIEKAEQHFQKGKKFYQAKDVENSRKQFDEAVDLMLAAGEHNINDKRGYDKKFDQMVDAIHRYDLAGLGAAVDVDGISFEKAPLEDILEMTFPVDPKLKDKVRDQVLATASQLPLVVNDAVLSYINYFSGRGHKTLLAGLERAGRYRPMVQRILDEEGVPQELIHLAQAESGFIPHAISRAKAVGMWQFVAFRGQEYGLMQTKDYDDRMDPERATRAAARHLHDLFTEFGDWHLAIAAYNCGPGVIEKAVERSGYADFWELRNRHLVPAETTNYVPIILAMTIMDKNAAEYGLDNVVPDPPLEYDEIDITSPTHLALIADLTDTPVSELMSLNPALLKPVAPQGRALRVPKGTASTLMAALQLIPPERRLSWRIHTVQSGETLEAIGKRYGTSPSSILAANKMEPDGPVVGDRLVIPAVQKSAPTKPVKSTSTAHSHRSSSHSATRHSASHSSTRHTTTKSASSHKPSSSRTTRTTASKAPAKKKSSATAVAKQPAKTRSSGVRTAASSRRPLSERN